MFTEPPTLRHVARALTWGGLALEALVAAAFLLPVSRRWPSLRHVLLLVFCVVTYGVAPVAGFGWLLAVLGLSQCREDQTLLRSSYVAAFVLILLYAETHAVAGLLERMA